jgi:hypothetical protein
MQSEICLVDMFRPETVIIITLFFIKDDKNSREVISGVFHITLGMGPGPLDLGILAIFVLIGSFKNF